MARKFAPWVSGRSCTGSALPGAKALMAGVLAHEPKARNLGILACRNVRGSSDTSVHAEGRAIDIGLPMSNGRPTAVGRALLKKLLDNADRLGLQAVIYERKIYSAKSPNGRAYNGVNPHYDHIHAELSWDAGRRLTLATVKAVLGGTVPDPKPPVVTPPAPSQTTYTVKSGDSLSEIAEKFDTTVAQLVAWNGIANPDQIAVGQKLRVRSTATDPKPLPTQPSLNVEWDDSLAPNTRSDLVPSLKRALNLVGLFPKPDGPAYSTAYDNPVSDAVAAWHRTSAGKPYTTGGYDAAIGPRGFEALLKQAKAVKG